MATAMRRLLFQQHTRVRFLCTRSSEAQSSLASQSQVRPKESKVISRPSPAAEFTRVTAHPGVLKSKGFTIMDFLKSVGTGLQGHHEKLSSICEDFRDVLVVNGKALKKLGIPVTDRKLILRYAHRYRLGVWKPRRSRKTKAPKEGEQKK